jgi:hypothetical protein
MTRLPLEDRDVRGVDGPGYGLNLICAAPDCTDRSLENHHLWRRSALGGPFSWVSLPDGSQVGNVVRLCHIHHRRVTENTAAISWNGYQFLWVPDGFDSDQALSFQPPHILGEVDPAFENAGEKTNGDLLPNECPACHQPLPKPKIERPKEQARPRRSWTITVPVDRRENGAETLDTLLEEARLELAKADLAYGPARNVRFFVLATALGLFVAHFRELVSE